MLKRLIFIVILLTQLTGANAMGIMDAGRVCLFSKISGVITFKGKPAANALLVRTASLSKDRIDETRTDENGYFEMPAVFERTVTKFLPQEFVARQVIEVNYNDQKIDIWSGVKRTSEENSEARGGKLEVSCELAQEELDLIEVNGSPIFSRCIWDVEPDPSSQDIWSTFDQE